VRHQDIPEVLNSLTERIIGCAIDVHRVLGPGLPEKIYEEAMCHELGLQGIAYERQLPVRLLYKGKELVGQRVDLIVERPIGVELKAVEQVIDLHLAQLVGYLRAGPNPLGLLINFNTPALRAGIQRRVNSRALLSLFPHTASTSASSA